MRKVLLLLALCGGVMSAAYATQCYVCQGTGLSQQLCWNCNGVGHKNGMRCLTCRGYGYPPCTACGGDGRICPAQ